MSEGKWVDVLSGPRFAGIPKFIKDECWTRGLKLKIEVEKGWIRETARIEVTGPEATVNRLRTDVYAALEAYGKRLKNAGETPS